MSIRKYAESKGIPPHIVNQLEREYNEAIAAVDELAKYATEVISLSRGTAIMALVKAGAKLFRQEQTDPRTLNAQIIALVQGFAYDLLHDDNEESLP